MFSYGDRLLLRGKTVGRAAKHVQGQLVENDDQRQTAGGAIAPVIERADACGCPHGFVTFSDHGINLRSGGKPFRAHVCRIPEIENVLRGWRVYHAALAS